MQRGATRRASHFYVDASINSICFVVRPGACVTLHGIERLGVHAAQTLFVDDTGVNVTGASDAGLQAHKFVSAVALSDELQRRGLL